MDLAPATDETALRGDDGDTRDLRDLAEVEAEDVVQQKRVGLVRHHQDDGRREDEQACSPQPRAHCTAA